MRSPMAASFNPNTGAAAAGRIAREKIAHNRPRCLVSGKTLPRRPPRLPGSAAAPAASLPNGILSSRQRVRGARRLARISTDLPRLCVLAPAWERRHPARRPVLRSLASGSLWRRRVLPPRIENNPEKLPALPRSTGEWTSRIPCRRRHAQSNALSWHTAHVRHCGCPRIPARLLELMHERRRRLNLRMLRPLAPSLLAGRPCTPRVSARTVEDLG